MTGTVTGLFTHKQSRSYLNHLVFLVNLMRQRLKNFSRKTRSHLKILGASKVRTNIQQATPYKSPWIYKPPVRGLQLVKTLRHCAEPNESIARSTQPTNSPYYLQTNRTNTTHHISLRSSHPVISTNSAQILQSLQFILFPLNILHLLLPLTVAYTLLS